MITMGELHLLDEGSMMPPLSISWISRCMAALYACGICLFSIFPVVFCAEHGCKLCQYTYKFLFLLLAQLHWTLRECGVISPYWDFVFLPIAVCLPAPVVPSPDSPGQDLSSSPSGLIWPRMWDTTLSVLFSFLSPHLLQSNLKGEWEFKYCAHAEGNPTIMHEHSLNTC